MSKKMPGGPVIPTAGDDLLASWPKFVNSLGYIAHVNSLKDAYALLDAMAASGNPPSQANPTYIEIDDVLYKSDGRRGPNFWTLRALNRPTVHLRFSGVSDGSIGGPERTREVAAGKYEKILNMVISPEPYARIVFAIGTCWTKLKGEADLELYRNPTDSVTGSRARCPSNDDGNTTVFWTGLVEPNEQIDLSMYVHAARYNNITLTTSRDEWTRLVAFGMPVSVDAVFNGLY